MRGKVFIMLARSYFLRITPAYAGKRHIKHMLSQTKRDHPRLCGEKLDGYSQSNFWTGSPPPMRGKADKFLIPSTCVRITPAYAGKSEPSGFMLPTSQDHPRLCGEKWSPVRTGQRKAGSPPPMRGKVLVAVQSQTDGGITPAYAGKRLRSLRSAPARGDHPRLCGEKYSMWLACGLFQGSPPPMRGKENHLSIFLTQFGITPAYAGKRQCEMCHSCMC